MSKLMNDFNRQLLIEAFYYDGFEHRGKKILPSLRKLGDTVFFSSKIFLVEKIVSAD
jgi:hypothetical protein